MPFAENIQKNLPPVKNYTGGKKYKSNCLRYRHIKAFKAHGWVAAEKAVFLSFPNAFKTRVGYLVGRYINRLGLIYCPIKEFFVVKSTALVAFGVFIWNVTINNAVGLDWYILIAGWKIDYLWSFETLETLEPLETFETLETLETLHKLLQPVYFFIVKR